MKLNLEQKKIVELKPNGHMLIKGVAGSGKTTISVEKAQNLVEHYCHDYNDRVLLVTFNNTLVSYINYIYTRSLRENNQQLQMIAGDMKNKIDIINVDKLTYKYYRQFEKENEVNYERPKIKEQKESIIRAISEISKKYPDTSIIDIKNYKFLLDEISWIKSCNILELDDYQDIDRIGRGAAEDGPSRVSKNSINRKAIFELCILYDELLFNKGYIDFERMNLISLDYIKTNNMKKYTHIIIDEAQDLTKVQLEFLKSLYMDKDYSSFIFSVDNTQSIYANSWLGRGRPYSTIGFDMSGRGRILNKNYRTTTEIAKAAYSLVENDNIIKNNIDYIEPTLMERNGLPPVYKSFKSNEDQLDFIIDEINILKEEYKLLNICILSRTARNMDYNIKYINSKGVKAEKVDPNKSNFSENSIKFTTIHSSKGLEFPIIFIMDLDDGNIPNDYFGKGNDIELHESDERKLFYVGMTRAKKMLYLTSLERKSKFIDDIDKNTLRFERGSKLRRFKEISPLDYRYENKIADKYSKEEVIRQWIINELIEVYNYNMADIEIEYPVHAFSQRGYVDVVVKRNGLEEIFIEVKQFGYGIDEGIEQLKSYMRCSDNVEYGLVTDGIKLKIMDKNFNDIGDIPKNNIFEDENLEPEDTIKFGENNLVPFKLPVVGDVAAGGLRFAEEYISDTVIYDIDKSMTSHSLFGLKVTGDSMIDKGIDIGDIVVVKKQNTAEFGDIVIARTGEEATMKTFTRSGSIIVLNPANKNYEAILMDEKDVEIDGVVIDCIKQ